MADGYNWFLILVAVVVALLVVAVSVYLIINYQHPEDANQAYFPKLIVLLGLTLAMYQVLLLPLDVANRAACKESIALSACHFTLPMDQLWSLGKRIWSGCLWLCAVCVTFGLILGLGYGLAGNVEYPVWRVTSGAQGINATASWATQINSANACVAPYYDVVSSANTCNAKSGGQKITWSIPTSFPVYVIAVGSIIGWILFMVFAGVGVIALPLDWIQGWFTRPKKQITKSEYIKAAGDLAKRGKDIREVAQGLQREERSGGKGRKWRRAFSQLQKEIVFLEEDQALLEECFPQGDKADVLWALVILGYLARLILGVIGMIVTILWLLHIILYILISPPVTPFLNSVFVKLDSFFGLFGTTAFALFCLYMIGCTIKGCTKVGLKFAFMSVYPMKVNGTLMSAMLFNTALILLCSISAIQFCSEAFDIYASETAVNLIYRVKISHLQGIKYLFKYNVFIWAFLACTLVSALVIAKSKKKKPRNARQRLRLDGHSSSSAKSPKK
eukprot:jgi/Chlat1/2371/Chrsp17S00180